MTLHLCDKCGNRIPQLSGFNILVSDLSDNTHPPETVLLCQACWNEFRETIRKEEKVSPLSNIVHILRDGLIKIASFPEGPVVKSSFDEPCSARIARDTLASAGIGANVGGADDQKKEGSGQP